MRILVSNDDGFHAEGIQVLATELRKIAEVIVVAPDRNRSAASSSLTWSQLHLTGWSEKTSLKTYTKKTPKTFG